MTVPVRQRSVPPPAAPGGDTIALIVDLARGTRHLDPARSEPVSLTEVDADRTVLDWIVHALSANSVRDVVYLGGYHIEKVVQAHPELRFRYDAHWQDRGEVAALAAVIGSRPRRPHLIVRAGTVHLPAAFERLALASASGVAVGEYRSAAGRAFAGSILVPAGSGEAFTALAAVARAEPDAGLERWLAELAARGVRVTPADLDAVAAPMSDRVALARVIFGGKARTLEQIGPLVRSARVPEQERFTVSEWRSSRDAVLARITARFGDGPLAVRSSAASEDRLSSSEAGRFRTVLDVRGPALFAAVEDVVESYRTRGRVPHPDDEVFVQPHLSGLAASGVLFTRDVETGAPYYVITVDRSTGRSDSVTSGSDVPTDTFYIARSTEPDALPEPIRPVIALGREIETLTSLDSLDIEFGVASDGTLHLFQARPIARLAHQYELADDDLEAELGQIASFLRDHLRPDPMLAGSTTVFGTMPDWNPAEMIGVAPKPLALSLYQRLIGASAWSEARHRIGYRDVRPVPLIVSLGGRPYVDVRASLNSFLPADLDERIADTWVDHCIALLAADPRLHDKIEFEVTLTCAGVDVEGDRARLRAAGLGSEEIGRFAASLTRLTTAMVHGGAPRPEAELASLALLDDRRRRWERGPAGVAGLARRIHVLVEDCERHGVVPFAVLARYAFVAMALLRSLERVGVISGAERESVFRGVPTVSRDLSWALSEHASGRLGIDTLLARFGHLRPRSYDITSPNYSAGWRTYLAEARGTGPADPEDGGVAVLERRRDAIDRALSAAQLGFSTDDLAAFVRVSISGRERAKFEFMRSLDATLESIAELGSRLGVDREDMAYMTLERIVKLAADSPSAAVEREFRRTIEFNKKRWSITSALRMPQLVRGPADIRTFELEPTSPNFITSQRVVAAPVLVDALERPADLTGRVALIRSADPGYDWVFGHGIVGLVTEFGGIGSHMAVRSAEHGLPAAIGCGPAIFDRLASATAIELDCAHRVVRPVA